jgi:hypothetical protein
MDRKKIAFPFAAFTLTIFTLGEEDPPFFRSHEVGQRSSAYIASRFVTVVPLSIRSVDLRSMNERQLSGLTVMHANDGVGATCQPSASGRPIGSFCQKRTLMVADVNDRLWSNTIIAHLAIGCPLSPTTPESGLFRISDLT